MTQKCGFIDGEMVLVYYNTNSIGLVLYRGLLID